jgi:hydrogenase nickel incorporation protein HypA/HybF
MHELSIALTLIDLAADEARRLVTSRVTAVHVQIGADSGVAVEALRFSFDLAADGTAIAGARLEVEQVPGTALQLRALEVVDDVHQNR